MRFNARTISGNASMFLDSARIFAALAVLFLHVQEFWYPIKGGENLYPPQYAHSAVIIFFVLSGFVIAHTTANNNRGSFQYAVSRLSRLSSVVWPALVVTVIIQYMVSKFDPALYSSFMRGPSFIRYMLSGLYLNEILTLSAAPKINIPLWSLSYEFWYYVIFGFWFFKGKGWKSYILPIVVCLVAGPKILLMFPIWLVGVVAYNSSRPLLKTSTSWLLVAAFLILAFLTVVYVPSYPFKIGSPPLFYSYQFITDWLISVFVGLAFWILPTNNLKPVHKQKEMIFRKVADLTFPLYVMHYPLLILYRSIFGLKLYNSVQYISVVLFAIAICACIGLVLDKYRYLWVNLFKYLFGFFKNRPKLQVYQQKAEV